ncbi:MAG: nucleotidyltransferase domain-containing protein [Bacteroidales bacterium]|nr:nucleotidyltransferase domain-containing protein [Bacteroidales bacterium]
MISQKISEIINKIVAEYDPEQIILFGSYANGNPSDNSDLDLFIIKESYLPRPERSVNIRRMLAEENIPMDIIVYTPDEVKRSKSNPYSFVYEVLTSGITLYEKSNRVYKNMDD